MERAQFSQEIFGSGKAEWTPGKCCEKSDLVKSLFALSVTALNFSNVSCSNIVYICIAYPGVNVLVLRLQISGLIVDHFVRLCQPFPWIARPIRTFTAVLDAAMWRENLSCFWRISEVVAGCPAARRNTHAHRSLSLVVRVRRYC
jgi:hypothetical protein